MSLLTAMRPGEWVKNLLVFAGLLFSGALDQGAQVLDATITFVAFCAVSSAGYLLNDLRDREHDRRHPEKRLRPIASGALAPATAAGALVALGPGRSASASWSSPRSPDWSPSTARSPPPTRWCSSGW